MTFPLGTSCLWINTMVLLPISIRVPTPFARWPYLFAALVSHSCRIDGSNRRSSYSITHPVVGWMTLLVRLHWNSWLARYCAAQALYVRSSDGAPGMRYGPRFFHWLLWIMQWVLGTSLSVRIRCSRSGLCIGFGILVVVTSWPGVGTLVVVTVLAGVCTLKVKTGLCSCFDLLLAL